MNLLLLTAGAADMFCGSCLRDNALAAALMARGHRVSLLPIYTPTVTDEPNVSAGQRVFLGGISVYLQQHVPLFRHTPWLLDRLWDSASVIKHFASRSIDVDPHMLGPLTVSTLRGERGNQHKEIDKLLAFLRDEERPDLVNIPNALLIPLAAPIRRALNRPIVVTLQGEDLFLDGLPDPYRTQAIELIRAQIDDVDVFVSVSEYYTNFMSDYLRIPKARIRTVPLGIDVKAFTPRSDGRDPASHSSPFTIGYLARIAPEKGLHNLAEAYRLLRRDRGLPASRLVAAGFLGRSQRAYLTDIERKLETCGLLSEFEYVGSVDRADKIRFLHRVDVLSVPSDYVEPKGLYLLEAMACGVPVVQPNHGAFPEMLQRTGGGILADSAHPEHIADRIYELWKNPARAAALGRHGAEGVRAHYTIDRMADRTLEVYRELVDNRAGSEPSHQNLSVASR